MAEYTTNYNLKKPLLTEKYNVDDQNGNMDILDTEIKKLDTQMVDLTVNKADNSEVGKVGYFQNTEPADKTEKKVWYNPDTGLLYISDGTKYIPVPPVQILEEVIDFDESDIITTHNNTELVNGSIQLSGISTSGYSVIQWNNTPYDINAWDLVTYQTTLDNEMVTIDIEETVLMNTGGSSISRGADNETYVNNSSKRGLQITPKTNIVSLECTLSSNISGHTKVYIYDVSNSELIISKDISSVLAGETFSLDNILLKKGKTYNIVIDAEGSNMTHGRKNNSSFPYTSAHFDIIASAYLTNQSYTTYVDNIETIYVTEYLAWQTVFTDIDPNFNISTIDPNKDIRFKVNISRVNSANNPTCDYLARRYVR